MLAACATFTYGLRLWYIKFLLLTYGHLGCWRLYGVVFGGVLGILELDGGDGAAPLGEVYS